MSVVQTTVERVRTYLKDHHAAVRAVPLAKELGVKDIRVMRAALRDMKSAGELVSCTVFVGELQDEEYRLSSVGPAFCTHVSGKQATLKPYARPQTPRPEIAQPVHKPKIEPVATPVAPAARPTKSNRRPPPMAPRRKAIVAYIEQVQRGVTSSELLRVFRDAGEAELRLPSVCCSLKDSVTAGCLVIVAQHGAQKVYATPAIAERLKVTTGSGGESTSAVQPITAKAAEPAAAPLGAEQPEQKTALLEEELRKAKATIAMLDEHLERACSWNTRVDPGFNVEVRTRIEEFFRGCDGNWYGLPWLVRVAGGSVPDTLESLAALQRAKKLAYSEADRAPIWHPVEGCW